MSLHCFETIHDYEITTILMGWDRPLKGFFMSIDKESNTNADAPFWSNLNYKISHPTTLYFFLNVLDEFGIILPAQMIVELMEDKYNNMGNKRVVHRLEYGFHKRDEAWF